MKKGFFQKGDIVEISGQIYGLVTYADEITADIQRVAITSTGNFLTTAKQIVGNSSDSYKDIYWIKKLKRQDVSLEYLLIKPLSEL